MRGDTQSVNVQLVGGDVVRVKRQDAEALLKSGNASAFVPNYVFKATQYGIGRAEAVKLGEKKVLERVRAFRKKQAENCRDNQKDDD